MLCILLVQFFEMSFEPVLTVPPYIGCSYACLPVWMLYRISRSSETNSTQPKFFAGFLLLLVNVKIYLYVLTLLATHFVPMFSTASGLFLQS